MVTDPVPDTEDDRDDQARCTERDKPKRATSAKQVAANRANGKKSKGPRSQEGKERSKLNARKHGSWSTSVDPITSGPFAEDPADFRHLVESLGRSLPQRDAAEEGVVRQIITEFVRLSRTDRLEAAVLLAGSHFEPDRLEEIGDPLEIEGRITALTFVMNTFDHLIGEVDPTSYEEGEEPAWHFAALNLRTICPNPRVGVKDLWDKDNTPDSDEGWRLVARTLYEHHWGDADVFRNYLNNLSRELADEHARRCARLDDISARQQLRAITDLVERPRNHAWRRLQEAFKLYQQLQQRNLDE